MKKSIIRLFLLMSFFVTMGSTNIKASMIDADVTGEFQNPYSASAMHRFTDNTTMDAATAPFGYVKLDMNGVNPLMYLPPDPNEPFLTPLGGAPTILLVVLLIIYVVLKRKRATHKEL